MTRAPKPPILASTIHIAVVASVRQVLGRHAVTSDWVVLATLDAASDARVMLADVPTLAKSLGFVLVEDRPPPSRSLLDILLGR